MTDAAPDSPPQPPLFLVGAGRSGSTVFHAMLSEHPRVAWLSGLSNRYPDRPGIQRLAMRLAGLPLAGPALRGRLRPLEAYPFWEHHCPGFRRPFRDLVAEDVTERQRRRTRRAVAALTGAARTRFVAKLTGWPRIGFLAEIFPEARFVHLVRDGRAVAASYCRMPVEAWWGWRGPSSWRFGPLDEASRREWDAAGRSFVVLAGLQWKIVLEAVREAAATLGGDRLLEVRYEDLCERPTEVLGEVGRFASLPDNARFRERIGGYALGSRNDRWRDDLTAAQQEMLTAALREPLERYGYR